MESYYKLFKEDDPKFIQEDSQDFKSLDNLSINTYNSVDFNNNIYIDKKKCNFKQIEDIVNSHKLEEFNSDKDILEHFAELEKIVIIKIKISHDENSSKFYLKLLKDMAFDLLENKFKEYKRYKELYKLIKNIFISFFDAFYKQDSFIELMEDEEQILKMLNENTNMEKFSVSDANLSNLKKFQKEGEKVTALFKLFKKIYQKNINRLIERLQKYFGVENFPFFLVRTAKFKIKRKINKKYLPKFKEIFLRNNFLNSLEYSIIVDKIKEISQKKLEIFDEKILSLEIREIIFKIIISVCTNVFTSLENDVNNNSPGKINDDYFKKLFLDNIEKYIYALGVNVDLRNENSINSFSIIKKSIKNKENSSISFFSKSINETESLKELFMNLEMSIKNDLDKYLFIILSLSLIFNNYDLGQKEILNTSAREKECLRKILLGFNEYYRHENLDVWKFNQILESVIFSTFYKHKYSSNLISDKHNSINEDKRSSVKGRIHFDKINKILLQDSMTKNFIDEYNLLIERTPKKQKQKCCKNVLRFFKEFFFPYEEKEVVVDLNLTSFLPYDKFNHSNHVCIIIPGFISQHHEYHYQWENFIIDFDIYVDFYFFCWESKFGMKIINDIMKFLGGLSLTLLTRNFLKVFGAYRTYQHKNNLFAKTTRTSKYFGKLLAYILASKSIFEKRQITLVGFSLGGHIIKHCLKELVLISEYMPEVKDIIHNVVFIGGATYIPSQKDIWKNIYKFIAGRIINCYSPNDEVLQGIFKYITQKDSLGIIPLKIDNLDWLIENYDFSDLNIKHVEYKSYFNEIIKKINLF